MKLKLDDAGHAVLQEGKPVYVHDDGKEIPFDAAAAVASINSRTDQSRRVETENKELRDRIKLFDGLEDPAAARKALDVVKNLDAKKLIDAGEVDKVKAEAAKAFEDQIKQIEAKYGPVVKERDDFRSALYAEKVGGSFARSKFIADKLAIPPDMVQAAFGSAFKVEGDKIIGYRGDEKIFSRVKPGDVAEFDEALEIIVDAYPFKDHIFKGTGASGGGSLGGSRSGKRTVTRAQLDDWSTNDPIRASEAMKEVREGKAELVA